MARYIGALDQGTTSTRFMVFDAAGSEIARHQLEHRQMLPGPGLVEHDPMSTIHAPGTRLGRANGGYHAPGAYMTSNGTEIAVDPAREPSRNPVDAGRPCHVLSAHN